MSKGNLSRRSFLTAGATGFAGLSLADLLQAEAASGIGSSQKAVINIHLDGGPSQLDLIDLKPQAPAEIRGEFRPIATRLPGFQICELMPKVASIADRFAFIRSLVGSAGAHSTTTCSADPSVKLLLRHTPRRGSHCRTGSALSCGRRGENP